MTDALSLDLWLAKLYSAEHKQKLAEAMTEFKAALIADPVELATHAQARMKELDLLIARRGRRACDYSAKYDDYLHEALDASS